MEQTAKQKAPGEEHPGFRQSQASNPGRSHWVGASAGTGKTKVLTDRVLRLMLPRPGQGKESAAAPGRVLCLTFTRTAAAEMSHRIYERLSAWSVMEDEALRDALRGLTGAEPGAETMEEARRLFARVLDTPGGLKIMTIHSFCQSVLKRFPVEAGVAPHFEMTDERGAVEYLTRCLHDIIAGAQAAPESALSAAFSLLALHLDSAGMSDLMSKIMSGRSLLSGILDRRGGAAGAAAAVYERLGADPALTEEDILSRAGNIPPALEEDLRRALQGLLAGGSRDTGRAAFLQQWLEQKDRRADLLPLYRRVFFTQEGGVLKSLASKAAAAVCPDAAEILAREAARLEELEARLQNQRLAALNAALLTVAAEMLERYARHKRHTDRLDFDDLIIKTCALLAGEGAVPWVLFKLDEGIDHILVDEAQDTSLHQWRVVQSLSGEFFSGHGARGAAARTLFVVGDEKQSIFSFQGADPEAFARMQDFFGARAAGVQEGWEILLEYSFRSARAVLETVDAVFAQAAPARRGVVLPGHDARHLPFREGQAGLVELWPLTTLSAPAGEEEDGEGWQPPVAVAGGENAAAALAGKIARTLRGWLDAGEMLESKGRPLRPGDILVLVQSRGAFVELLMRALKEARIPVAGIDRMTLTEEIAVMDLIAAAQFALLPRDDLTLATLLKSPLLGLGEDDLYALCHGRPSSLWAAVQDRRPDIAGFLSGWIARAGHDTPYAFFAAILNTPCPADAVSGRRGFYARLGPDVQDALDEFLNACLHFEQAHTPSVQGFTDWFLRGEAEIKREQDSARADQVRIMTAHGAKGLQAPVVFMPDTVKKLHDHNRGRIRLLWPADDGGVPLWSPRQEFDAPPYAALRDAAREKQEEEYRRLLYVAMTRAEDRLYVCGWHGRKQPAEDCWYNLVAGAFPPRAESIPCADGGTLRRLRNDQSAPPETGKQAREDTPAAAQPLPAWAREAPAPESFPPAPLAPSRPGEDEPAARGPLDSAQDWKFRRGVIVHGILEVLPQLPRSARAGALAAFLVRPALAIPEGERAAFAAEIMAVLEHPDFAPIFGPGSRAEAPVVGQAGDQVISGQIDRLLVTEDTVLIVDYKTNRPPPRDVSGVPGIYVKQMAAYRAVIAKIYPRHKINCALLWTDGPFLMPLPES